MLIWHSNAHMGASLVQAFDVLLLSSTVRVGLPHVHERWLQVWAAHFITSHEKESAADRPTSNSSSTKYISGLSSTFTKIYIEPGQAAQKAG